MDKRYLDITGLVFNRLTAIKYSHTNNDRFAVWEWECFCGNKKNIIAANVRSGSTKSCGCLQKELGSITGKYYAGKRHGNYGKQSLNHKGYGESSLNHIFNTYKRTALKRGLVFNIEIKSFKFIIQSNCYYCNNSPSMIRKNKGCFGEFVYNGIDRINNNIGYEISNSVPCCKICNIAKSTLSFNEFYDWVKRISENMLFPIRLQAAGQLT
ncbi:MAG: hypothetical protein A2Z57_04005 [Planctomycetes bacterium RIFCSPHIGHO2_12_39_6]|nr:MAG: hypothetical protein A2Z57_04005 [Planctomycetes bacterium RIFCSPHIGHO2_12_39_6]